MKKQDKVKVLKYVIIIVLLHTIAWGQQIGFEEIDDTKVKPWLTKLALEYQGVYHFGDSEGESSFRLIITDDECYAQIQSGHFSDNGTKWLWYYTNLKKVMIKGNRFFSNETDGDFIIYGEKTFGLKVYKPWSGMIKKGNYEIGVKKGDIEWSYPGKYSQASIRLLKEDELKTMSKTELEIMRNEIFARYGYIFNASGEMERYFKQQHWYEGQYKNVSKFLTDLEKENIKLINRIEKRYKEN